MQRLLAGFSTALLAVAFLQAPFAHDHPEDPEHHHAAGFVHSHLVVDDHHSDDVEIEAHDDDAVAIYREWMPAAAARIDIVQAETVAVSVLAAVFTQLGIAPDLEPRANSPPSVRLPPARSPPV